jgi:hypothetical protein
MQKALRFGVSTTNQTHLRNPSRKEKAETIPVVKQVSRPLTFVNKTKPIAVLWTNAETENGVSVEDEDFAKYRVRRPSDLSASPFCASYGLFAS